MTVDRQYELMMIGVAGAAIIANAIVLVTPRLAMLRTILWRAVAMLLMTLWYFMSAAPGSTALAVFSVLGALIICVLKPILDAHTWPCEACRGTGRVGGADQ